jgi:hypothetical protein
LVTANVHHFKDIPSFAYRLDRRSFRGERITVVKIAILEFRAAKNFAGRKNPFVFAF